MISSDQGYTPIPDVEEGLVKDSSNVDVISPAQKYPQANEQELAFLVALDDAIENADPEIRLPTLKAKDLGPPDSPKEFLNTLKIPTLAFGASTLSALIIIATNNPFFFALFPYYSCILMFISSIPPMKERVTEQFNRITAKIQNVIGKVTELIESISQSALGYVDKAESLMDNALAPMKEKLDNATKLEKLLQKIDPSIDIPDPQDIEEAFDGFSDKIKAIFAVVNEAVDLVRSIPMPLQNEENFNKYVFYPIMAVILVLQLLAVWGSTHSQGYDEILSTNSTLSNSTLTSNTEAPNNDWSEVSNQANLLVTSFQTYVSTIVQLVLIYVSTQVAALIIAFNKLVKNFEDDANSVIDKYAKKPFKEVFEEGFTKVKETILKLINKMEKLEGPLKKAEDLADAEAKAKALLEKAKAEAAARAQKLKEEAMLRAQKAKEEAERKLREAQEKAKAEAERKAREAKEEAEKKIKEAQEKMKAEAERKAKEAQEEAERKAREAKEEMERQAQEAKEKAEKAKAAAEKLAKFGGGGFGF